MALEKAKEIIVEHKAELLIGTAASLMVAALAKVGPRAYDYVSGTLNTLHDGLDSPGPDDPSDNS